MKRLCLALAVMGTVVMSAPTLVGQSRGLGTLNGVVTSDQGEPIEKAAIKVHLTGGNAIEAKTDGSGRWNLIGVGKGEFQVEFIKDGFETKRVTVVVAKEAMQTTPIKISMKKG